MLAFGQRNKNQSSYRSYILQKAKVNLTVFNFHRKNDELDLLTDKKMLGEPVVDRVASRSSAYGRVAFPCFNLGEVLSCCRDIHILMNVIIKLKSCVKLVIKLNLKVKF